MIKVTTEMHRVLKLDIYVFIANLSVLSILYTFTILGSKTLLTFNFVGKAVTSISTNNRGRGGGVVVVIAWKLDFQLPVQSVPITTNVAISNTVHGEVYSIQQYVIQFVSDLRQVGGFLRFSPPITLTTTI